MKFKKSVAAVLAVFLFFIFIVAGNAQTKGRSPKSKSTIAPKQASVPTNAVIQSLLKASLADFTDGIKKEDFTALHANASKDFQATFTVPQLATTFQVFIDKRDSVLPSLNNVSRRTAKFAPAPFIRTEKGYKILVLSGEFPSQPYPVKFENEYEWENGAWKLLIIKVKM
jgi:hypothetical protein